METGFLTNPKLLLEERLGIVLSVVIMDPDCHFHMFPLGAVASLIFFPTLLSTTCCGILLIIIALGLTSLLFRQLVTQILMDMARILHVSFQVVQPAQLMDLVLHATHVTTCSGEAA